MLMVWRSSEGDLKGISTSDQQMKPWMGQDVDDC